MEREQHAVQFPLAELELPRVHQAFAHQAADQIDLGRGVEHVGQQPPGQRAAAGEFAGGGGHELLKLGLVPILLRVAALGPLPLQVLPGPQQARVLRVGGDLVEAFAPAGDPHVVLVGQHVDVALLVELRAAGAAENLVRRAGLQHLLFFRGAFEDAGQHHAAGRQVDACRKRLRADGDGEELVLEEFFDDSPVLGEQPRMMDGHAAQQELPQFRPGPCDQSKRLSSSTSRACWPSLRIFLPLICSATDQHSSRLKQKTKAGVRRASSLPPAISSRCSLSSISPTQWKPSGTLRSWP